MISSCEHSDTFWRHVNSCDNYFETTMSFLKSWNHRNQITPRKSLYLVIVLCRTILTHRWIHTTLLHTCIHILIERIKTITQHTIHKQIQDYYVIMKLNDRTKSTMALYRLFLVSYMLRNIKIPGMGTPHDYPKMMLCQILMMVYWLSCGLPVWKVMEHNICVFNEEMGETYYSILARCVLGDNIKSDFDHMNKIFSLLPLYKNVKDDISNDSNNKPFSHTWHHNVPVDAEEVTATVTFFCINR